MVSFESLKSEYERNWSNLEIRPSRLADANGVARKAINGKATYQQIERLTGVPWYFAALCHYRESNFDFDTYLGNGETLHRVTTIVPKGRGPFTTFVDGAVDAFRIENFIGAHDWGIARILFRLEAFNGEDGTRHRRLGAHRAALFSDREPECGWSCRTARDDRVGGAGPRPVRDADLAGAHGLGRARQAREVGARHRAAAEADDVRPFASSAVGIGNGCRTPLHQHALARIVRETCSGLER